MPASPQRAAAGIKDFNSPLGAPGEQVVSLIRLSTVCHDCGLRRLIIRPGAIGDCVLALPAMEYLKVEFTEVWVPANVKPIIRFADRVRSIHGTGLDLLGLPGLAPPSALLEDLRGFDSIVSWYGANREEFRTALMECGPPVQFMTALPDAANRLHCADFFAQQVGAPLPAIPKLRGFPAAREMFAAIQPFSGSARKNWQLDRYRELACRLPLPVRWCAGPDEDLEGAVRFAKLDDLAAWLARAQVYIGNDSGITHLAAAVGANVVAIFGPTDPAIWSPRGQRSAVVHGPLAEITVQHVEEQIARFLR